MELTSINNIRALFAKHGFEFTKSLGQNFLINPSVCPKIAEKGGAGAGVCALEIGAGVGVLTKELAMRCDKVVCVEIDKTLGPILAETLADFDNVEIVFADVLTLDLRELIERKFGGAKTICCANLPYYITSPVIMKLLEEKLPLESITVMVQKEAGERIIALPGERTCGAISVAVRYYSEARKLFYVPRGSFMPAPNVDSMVIGLKPHKENPYTLYEKLFFAIVKAAFSQRRKQLVNPLSSALGLSKDVVRARVESAGISPTARAENLTLDDFVNLCIEFTKKEKQT